MEITEGLQKRCALLKEVHDYGAESGNYIARKHDVPSLFVTIAINKGIIQRLPNNRLAWASTAEPNTRMADTLDKACKEYMAKYSKKKEVETKVLDDIEEIFPLTKSTKREKDSIIRRYKALTEIYKKSTETLNKLARKYSITKNFFSVALHLKFIKRESNKVIWIYKTSPTLEIVKYINSKEKEYYSNKEQRNKSQSNIKKAIDNQVIPTKITETIQGIERYVQTTQPTEYNVKIRGNEIIMQFDDFSKLIGK